MNLAVASNFLDGVKNNELMTMLATNHTPLSANEPTPEKLRLKSKENLLLKAPMRSGYYKKKYRNFNNGPANQVNKWFNSTDDMDKTRSCAYCSSTDHHVSACPTYKQGMVSFATSRVILNQIDNNSGMLWRTSSTLAMRRLCQALRPPRHT